jgi:hypothetical protein
MSTQSMLSEAKLTVNGSEPSGMVIALSPCMKGETNMKSRLGGAVMAVAFIFGIIAATRTTADAQWRTSSGGYSNQQIQQGYQHGLNIGASDAQRRQSYSPQRSRYYRNASSQAFREGFVRGYDQGYRQYSGSSGGYRNDGYYGNNGGNNEQLQLGYSQGLSTGAIDRDRGQPYNPQRSSFYRNASSQAFREGFVRGYDESYRRYPASSGGYRNDGYGNRGGYGGYNQQEINNGYQQGLNTGASDGQKNQSYDPQRSRYYRNASSQAYREGFVRGYDEGYRRYNQNGNYRSNSSTNILERIFGRP